MASSLTAAYAGPPLPAQAASSGSAVVEQRLAECVTRGLMRGLNAAQAQHTRGGNMRIPNRLGAARGKLPAVLGLAAAAAAAAGGAVPAAPPAPTDAAPARPPAHPRDNHAR